MTNPKRPGEGYYFVRLSTSGGPRDAVSHKLPGWDDAPWRLWEALLVVGLFVASQLGLALLVVALWRLSGWSASFAPPDTNGMLAVLLPVTMVGSHLVGWASSWILVSVWHGRRFFAALALWPLWPRKLARPFFTGVLVQFAVLVGMAIFPPPADLESAFQQFFHLGAWAKITIVLMAGIAAPLLEEVLFRGLLLTAFRRHMRFAMAAVVVTVLFTALHMTQVGLYVPALMGIFVCGAMLARLRERSGSLWPPVAFHMGFNFAAMVPLIILDSIGAIPPS